MKKSNLQKKQIKYLISNIIFSAIALAALTICVVFILINYSLRNQISLSEKVKSELEEYNATHIYTQEDMDTQELRIREEENDKEKKLLLDDIKEIVENGYSPYYLFRELYPNDVVVMTNDGYTFFPILDELNLNTYVRDNFKEDETTKEITYVDDNQNVLSKKGIDVSSFNGDIDWKKVKADGVEFAFIRLGFRGSTEGKLSLDTKFEDNMNGAIDNGIDVGVYFYTQAVDEAEAVEEAEFVLEAISDFDITYPVVFDIEEYEGGRADKLSRDKYTQITQSFCNRIIEGGYKPMIYGNLKTMFVMLDLTKLKDYPKWFAYYSYPVYFPYEFDYWQYSSSGKVKGIEGTVDMNILVK